MIKAVIVGTSHMHANEVALYIKEQPEMELVGVADVPSEVEEIEKFRYTPGWNLENIKTNYCDNTFLDYKEMLDTQKPDIAFVLTENIQKAEVVEEIAKRGINVCIEKPIAVSMEEAKKIEESVAKYGVSAFVNWPVVWRPYLHKMKAALDSGIVGAPIKLRYINGHTGPLGKGAKHRGVTENAEEMTDETRSKTWWHQQSHGGGVFLDIACYGCFFTRWFLGTGAEKVLSYGANLNTPFGDTADNFAAVITYTDKMAVIEGTWTTPRAVIPSGPMVLCTDGVIMCTGGAENCPEVVAFDIYGNQLELPEIDMGVNFQNMPCHYADHVLHGKDLHEMVTLSANMDVMHLLDGVIKAAESGETEAL